MLATIAFWYGTYALAQGAGLALAWWAYSLNCAGPEPEPVRENAIISREGNVLRVRFHGRNR